VLNLFFVHTAVSSPKPRDSLRGPPTSSLIIVVVGKAVRGRSQWPRGLRHWSAAASWLGFGFAFLNPSGDMDGRMDGWMDGWMDVSCECCVWSGTGLCVELITRPG
jgi:hypothetical protein